MQKIHRLFPVRQVGNGHSVGRWLLHCRYIVDRFQIDWANVWSRAQLSPFCHPEARRGRRSSQLLRRSTRILPVG